jgi:hypothetical protein
MADPAPATTPPEPENPLAALLKRAIKAHPVLRDEKKLKVVANAGSVRLEGSVFTRDSLRQLLDLVARVPGGQNIPVLVEAEVKPPQPRKIVGRVPVVSPGPPSTDPRYSVRSVRPPKP